MFFKQRRINKLKIKAAKFKALSESSKRFTEGTTNSYFIEVYQGHLAKFTEAETELSILKECKQ
jgi:hypothetical protein